VLTLAADGMRQKDQLRQNGRCWMGIEKFDDVCSVCAKLKSVTGRSAR
jgi:hypothetical protein